MSIINLSYIKGEGFLTFFDPFYFSISDYQHRTVQIDGNNQDDPMSKSNGSGKSSLLEAISWGWYGELCRKNRYKDEVIYNRNGIKARVAWVESEFELSGDSYRVRRVISWKKSPDLYLWINEEEILKEATYGVKQQHLENILGMNFTAFQCCEIFGRDFMSFPDLKPADRGKILTDIRGLDRYVEAIKLCNEEIKKLQVTITNQQKTLNLIEGRISQLRELNYKDQIEEFETNRLTELDTLKSNEKACLFLLDKIEKTKKSETIKLRTEIVSYEMEQKKGDELLIHLPKIKSKHIELEKQLTKLQTSSSYLNQQLKVFNEELIKLQKLGVGKCPVCKQPITAEHIANEMYLYDKKSDDYNQQIKTLNSEILTTKEELTVKKQDLKHLEELQAAKEEYQRLINKAQLEILNLERNPEEERIKSNLENIRKGQKTIQEAPNPHKEQEENRKATLFSLVKESKAQKQQIEDLEIESKYYLFWIEGFKKIRLMLFGTMIDRFQDYAQTLLGQYTAELQIQFSTERETRSGTIKDEFDISITDSNGGILSYELYSGGEKQKIRLAIALALAQMIKDDCGKEFNFISFDEPNDSLDEVGKEINFDIFNKLAMEGKCVLVTDHDALFKEKFDHSIMIVKENGKSQIQLQTEGND